jgi:hypothetical protein
MFQAIVRNAGDTKTDTGKVNQKVITAQFNFRNQLQLMGKEEIVHEFAGGTLVIEHQQRIFC